MSLYAEMNTALELRDSFPIRSKEWREANAEVCAIRFAMILEARQEEYADRVENKSDSA